MRRERTTLERRSTKVSMTPVAVRGSIGQNSTDPVPTELEDYCKLLEGASPMEVDKTTDAAATRTRLYSAMNLKAVTADNPDDIRMGWLVPYSVEHEVDPTTENGWNGNTYALLFHGMFDGTDVFISISFA